jgi:hypothetical protein
MLVEESRILQVSSVNALQNNLANIKFSALLYQVMTIADEVDSQLMQTMDCHVMESTIHAAGVRVGGVNEPATVSGFRFTAQCARTLRRFLEAVKL